MSHRQQPSSDFENPWSRLATDTTSQHPSAKQSNPEHTKDEAGVCEAYAGIIESSDIDPLHHELAKGDRASKAQHSGAGAAPSKGL